MKNFGLGTRGFAAPEDANVAVCLLPGTEVAFDAPPSYGSNSFYEPDTKQVTTNVARFRQINKEDLHRHHDALEFGAGEFVLLTTLAENQIATVLQLPAAPKNDVEAQAQQRVEVVA